MKVVAVISDGIEQSIRLPQDCRLETSEVFIKRLGRSLVLIPKDVDPWQMFAQGLDDFTSDYMEERSQPTPEDRKEPFE